jgi:hypothetical protein
MSTSRLEVAVETVQVADEVWIATALLHRGNPKKKDFTIDEIRGRVQKGRIHPVLRPGVRVHVLRHLVANRPKDPARYRMLFPTARFTRRLFRKGDPFHPDREGSKIIPNSHEIPAQYRCLLDWGETDYAPPSRRGAREDSILELKGLGKEIWKNVDADAYVRRLREGWE